LLLQINRQVTRGGNDMSGLSLEDTRTAQVYLAKQFNEIGRSLVLSNQETWEVFLEQEETKLIPEQFLPVLKSVLLGKPNVSLETYRDIAAGALKKKQYCPIVHVLYGMTGGNLMPELVQHSMKMTAAVLTPARPDSSA